MFGAGKRQRSLIQLQAFPREYHRSLFMYMHQTPIDQAAERIIIRTSLACFPSQQCVIEKCVLKTNTAGEGIENIWKWTSTLLSLAFKYLEDDLKGKMNVKGLCLQRTNKRESRGKIETNHPSSLYLGWCCRPLTLLETFQLPRRIFSGVLFPRATDRHSWQVPRAEFEALLSLAVLGIGFASGGSGGLLGKLASWWGSLLV